MEREVRPCSDCRKPIVMPRWRDVDVGQNWYCIDCGGWTSRQDVVDNAREYRRRARARLEAEGRAA